MGCPRFYFDIAIERALKALILVILGILFFLSTASFAPVVHAARVATPIASPSGGGYSTSQSVTLSSATQASAVVGTYTVGTYPEAIAFDSSTNSIWVANFSSDTVTKLTAATGAVVGTYAVGTDPTAIAFDSSTNSIWVVNVTDSTVTKLTAATGAVVGTYAVGISPRAIAFDSSTNSIWVGGLTVGGDGIVTKLTAATGAVVGTYVIGTNDVGTNPHTITFDSSTNSIWVGNQTSNIVTKLTAATGAVVGTYAVGPDSSVPYIITFDPSTNSIWVPNFSSNTVTKLTAATGAVVGTYSVGSGPVSSTFDSSTNSIWVANTSNNTVTKLTAATGAVISTSPLADVFGASPKAITFDSSTNSIWVANSADGSVTKITTSDTPATIYYTTDGSTPTSGSTLYSGPISVSIPTTLKAIAILSGFTNSTVMSESYVPITQVATPIASPSGGEYSTSQSVTLSSATQGSVVVGTYAVGGGPKSAAFDSSTNSIWVVNGNDNTVTKLTASTGAVVGTYAVGAACFCGNGIAFDPSTNSIWVASNQAVKLNASTGAVVGTYAVGINPQGVAFDPSTNSIWVTNANSSTVTKLTAATGAVVGTYAVGSYPVAVAFDSSTNSMWVANYNSNTVSKLTAATGAVVGTYAVGTYPSSIAFDSSTNSVWVTNTNSNTVSKLTAATGALVGTYAVGSSPGSIAFDSSTNSIWVGNSISYTITRLSASTGAVVDTYAYTIGSGRRVGTFDPSTNSVWVSNATDNTLIKFTTSDTTASIYYTTDGSTPTPGSTLYSGPISVLPPTTLKAIGILSGFTDSTVMSEDYVLPPQTATPTASPLGGTYTEGKTVTLTTGTAGAAIYYTTDGSTPATTTAIQYITPLSASSTVTYKAIAWADGYSDSAVMTETYTITPSTTPTVTTGSASSLAQTTITLGGNITALGTTNVTERGVVYGATASYGATTSTTSASFSTGAYTENITGLTCGTTYHFSAYAVNSIGTDYGNDDTFTTSACDQTTTPTASPLGGTYTEGKTITLTSATPSAVIYYTSDGSTPATTTAIQYTVPLSASSTVTYKAIAWADGYNDSTVMTETYTITPSTTPTVTTGSASSLAQTTITLEGNITALGTTNVTERGIVYGATTSYGATSSASSAGFSTGAYTEDITGLTCNTTYHFSAYALNSIGIDFGDDATFTTSSCTPITDTPTASPAGGTFTGTQTVTLSTTTPNSLIFYTTDGSTPATTTAIQYTTPLSASSTVTYKAIAWASGYDASAVMTETYTITDYEVAEDKAALVIGAILGSNVDADNIVVSLATLPSTGSVYGATIIWASDTTGTISHDGQSVNRPAFVDGDTVVNLTATITKGASSDTKTFVLTVKKEPAGDVSTITSNTYTVSALGSSSETITNVPYGTAKAVFLTALFKSQSYEVFTTTGINDPVTTGDVLVVTAQDGSTVTNYTVSVLPLTAEQVVPDVSGFAIVNSTTPEVVITDLGSTASITVSSGTSDATINLGSFIANGTGTIPAIQVTAQNAYSVSVEIPASTVVMSASTTWSGILSAPTVTTITLPTESGVTKTLSTAIEVGFVGESLTFSKAVRLLIPNEAGKRVGYSVTSAFTEITSTCASDSQVTGDALSAGAECKIDVGSDLVIWTKHFTTFATYSQTTTSSSGGGGGGSSSSSRRTTTTATTTSATTTTTSTASTNTSEIERLLNLLATLKAQLQALLGISPSTSSVSLTRNLELGMEGEDVRALQVYLNTHGYPVSQAGVGSLGNETTYFGPSTKSAVIKFQNAHASTLLAPINLTSGTGYVGEKTRALINGVSSVVAVTPKPVALPVTVPVTPVVQTLKIGMVSDDVLKLQIFLNNNGFLIAYNGTGSLGNETTSFGIATEAAVMRYQNEYLDELGLTEATGIVDRVTRAHMGF